MTRIEKLSASLLAAAGIILLISFSLEGFWQWALVFFLAGATFDGRKVGFQSALLQLAPAAERSTYAALNTVLILPVAFLPLAAGLFLQLWSYAVFFLFVAFFISLGAMTIYRWDAR